MGFFNYTCEQGVGRSLVAHFICDDPTATTFKMLVGSVADPAYLADGTWTGPDSFNQYVLTCLIPDDQLVHGGNLAPTAVSYDVGGNFLSQSNGTGVANFPPSPNPPPLPPTGSPEPISLAIVAEKAVILSESVLVPNIQTTVLEQSVVEADVLVGKTLQIGEVEVI